MEETSDSARAWQELLSLGAGGVDYDEDRASALVAELNKRGEAEVVSWALPMLSAPDLWHRQAAAWVLGQYGYPDGRPFGDTVMPALAAAARIEHDDETRDFFVVALGHGDDPAWVEELLRYATDPYAPIRESVAGSLPSMFAGDDMSDDAIDALIRLTRDPDRRVRDWATMGIGSQTEQDSEAIRAALRARLDDDEDDDDETATTGEAALGLALRHDPSVYPYLQRWLAAPPADIGNLTIQAVEALGDPRLLAALKRLKSTDWAQTDPLPMVLDSAIAALEQFAP